MATGIDVLDKMTDGTRAQVERAQLLEPGLGAAIWRNHRDPAAVLSKPRGHILSLYLDGGRRTRRADKPSGFGGPGKICFLPSGHSSVWEVGGAMRFLHFYFDPQTLAAWTARALDRDHRDLEARELVYVEDAPTAAALRAVAAADWAEPADRLALSETAHALAVRNIERWFGPARPGAPRRGGLSPARRRRLLEAIEADLHRPLTLTHLAGLVGQSPWHFARMFRESVGVAPHRYVQARRMRRATRLLTAGKDPVGDVAAACGYASPTRFTAAVKTATGVTPSAIRAAGQRGR